MKVWILGSGGQMGRAMIDACQVLKIPFVASKRCDLDITDLEQVKRMGSSGGFTHMINCAAFTDVDGAEEKSKEAYGVNALGPENLGIVGRECGISVVHISTDYLFNGEKRSPYLEGDRPAPLNVYGKSKWEGEERLLSELSTACIVRTSWVFGNNGKNFISSALSLLRKEEHVQAADDQINRATYNRDLAHALLDLSFNSGIFHFANHTPLSRYAILQDFFEEAKERGLPLRCQKITPVLADSFPTRSPRPSYSVLSTEKIERVLGRKPRLWKTVLAEYFDYVQPNH